MTPEGQFRDEVSCAMRGLWTMTWHEDREISPGVPDLSYVMYRGEYETGWIELKATWQEKGPYKFKIQPSQHRWIADHCGKIPVHFLVAVTEKVWLIDGSHHKLLSEKITEQELNDIGIVMPRDNIRFILNDRLKALTNRSR